MVGVFTLFLFIRIFLLLPLVAEPGSLTAVAPSSLEGCWATRGGGVRGVSGGEVGGATGGEARGAGESERGAGVEPGASAAAAS